MMLIEKRQEIASKLEKALADRANDIAIKVFNYKNQLEAEPLSDEIVSMQKVLVAMDEVINYEAKTSTSFTEVKTEVKVEKPVEKTEEVNPTTEVEKQTILEVKVEDNVVKAQVIENENIETARPGMAYIGVPERR